MKDPARAALASIGFATKKDDPEQEGKWTTHCQVSNYLPATYAPNEVIAEGEADIANFKPPKAVSAVHYSGVLCEKALNCGSVYDDSRLKGLFIGGLHESVRFQRGYTEMLKKLQLISTLHYMRHPCQSYGK